ncbi:MAG: inorganic phosphate transporter [Bacteroidales bacterium]
MILFFLTSGLFLGWSLGANDAANVFGTAVGSRMVRFRKAAIIAGIFVIVGAVVQGSGTSATLTDLGTIAKPAAAFTVALAAAGTVFAMTRFKLPVSSSQAIVGAIIGWNFYAGQPTDLAVVAEITGAWVSGPLLGALFTMGLFYLYRFVAGHIKVHLLIKDAFIRYWLLIVGAFGAYSLGANNIANVMGVFIPSVEFAPLDLGIFTLNSNQQLFFLGGIAIAVGIFTYSHRVMRTVGNDLMPLTAEAAIVVVLAHSLVLFIFSSTWLSESLQSLGLPPVPLVPISSSQVIIGSILGLGLLKGIRQVKLNILGRIAIGWLVLPLASGLIAFLMLFFIDNVFRQEVEDDRKHGKAAIHKHYPAQTVEGKKNQAIRFPGM